MTADACVKAELVRVLLSRHGESFAEELGIDVPANTPSELFRLLCVSILSSSRIRAPIAMAAARALFERGWTTPRRLLESDWQARVQALNGAGYTRYDESTARMLGETAERLEKDYGGDLRRLRAAADRVPDEEKRLLKEFKGLGDVGVNIFFREVQCAWGELYPFADRKSLQAARRLGLARSVDDLVALVEPRDFVRLVAALVRVSLQKRYDEVIAAAEG